MPQLFSVRWPFFVRLEAAALFPVAIRLAGDIDPIRTYVDERLFATLSPVAVPFGVPHDVIFWAGVTITVIVPYFILLLAADRLLTVRRGYALLSLVAIAVWAAACARMPFLLTGLVPERLLAGTNLLSLNQHSALAGGGLALLLHLRPLWVGLRDQGNVAERLIARHTHPYRRGDPAQHPQDVYYRQTADFRGWHQQTQLKGLDPGPKENPAVKILVVLTWIGVIIGTGTAYLTWYGFPGFGPGFTKHETGPVVETGPFRPGAGAKTAMPVPTVSVPAARSAPAIPQADVHAVTNLPLPTVQRPTEMSASVQTGNTISGPNEAVAERESDGSFAFDAVVNGTHVRMLFDTGASVVGLRAEDAVRLGIPVTRLNYAAKIKTANGTADVAPVMIDTMIIGNITLRNVAGFVAKQGMLHENLLGQTFLERLSGFNVEKNLLVLKGR